MRDDIKINDCFGYTRPNYQKKTREFWYRCKLDVYNQRLIWNQSGRAGLCKIINLPVLYQVRRKFAYQIGRSDKLSEAVKVEVTCPAWKITNQSLRPRRLDFATSLNRSITKMKRSKSKLTPFGYFLQRHGWSVGSARKQMIQCGPLQEHHGCKVVADLFLPYVFKFFFRCGHGNFFSILVSNDITWRWALVHHLKLGAMCQQPDISTEKRPSVRTCLDSTNHWWSDSISGMQDYALGPWWTTTTSYQRFHLSRRPGLKY